MSFRTSQIYVGPQTKRLLYLIGKSRELTADECADDLLMKIMLKEYPALLAYLDAIDELEKKTIASIK